MMRCFFLLLFLAFCFEARSQVEVWRGSTDTSTYIRPQDTITLPPKFGNGESDFFSYLETHFNLHTTFGELDYNIENIRFSFYVEKDGKVSDFQLQYGSNAIVSNEIERLVTSMPEWTPGILVGKKKRTLMIYDLNIRRVNDTPPVEITKNGFNLEYSDQTKQLKWFIVSGALLILVSLWITSSLR